MASRHISTNAPQIAARFRRRAARLSRALRAGLRRWAAAVDAAQVDNLRGGARPGDYPVPVRTGNLLGSHFFGLQGARRAVVGNTAAYALAVHDGRGSSAPHGPRPFLDDAADAVDGPALMALEVRRAVLAL